MELFQRSYHEHVIRNERDYLEILEYIENNPARWADDRYYAESFRIRIHNSELRIPGRMTAYPAGISAPSNNYPLTPGLLLRFGSSGPGFILSPALSGSILKFSSKSGSISLVFLV